MRLTADLILRSGSYFNPLRERELNLRGNKLAVIENLGVTQDQFDCIDLSDNEIVKLDGFPLLHRLRTLLLNNNKISKIGSLGESLPSLTTLILTNNKLVNFPDLDPLGELQSLTHLSLLDNLVTKKQHYRLYVISKLPKLKVLDFRKVKQTERTASEKLFGKPVAATASKGTKTEQQPPAAPVPATSIAPATTPNTLDPAQVQAIKQAIANASSLEEVAILEKALATGQLPPSLQSHSNGNTNNPDAMAE